MKTSGMILSWNRPVVGREGNALELFSMATSYFEKQQRGGVISSFEPVILGNYGGTLNGFVLVRGDSDKIAAMRHSKEFVELTTRCDYNLENFGVIPVYLDKDLSEVLQIWSKNIT